MTGIRIHMKVHKAAKHGIDVQDINVTWHYCDQDGCDYKAKQAGNLKQHKADVHDIDATWHHCDQDDCDFKAKIAANLKRHKLRKHNTNIEQTKMQQPEDPYPHLPYHLLIEKP